ncbi:hypothetical protein D9M68_948780 [compost metagenome]
MYLRYISPAIAGRSDFHFSILRKLDTLSSSSILSIIPRYLDIFIDGFNIENALSIISPGIVPTVSTIVSTSRYSAHLYSMFSRAPKSNGATYVVKVLSF